MKADKTILSKEASVNRLGMRLQQALVLILSVSYLVQGRKDGLTVGAIGIILLALWVPTIVTIIVYKKNPESPLLRHIIGVGYGLFYIAVCLLSDQQLVYTYAIPMLIVVTIYCDFKFSITVSVACIGVALIHSISYGVRNNFEVTAVSSIIIEMASMIMVSVYALIANKFIIDMNNKQLAATKEAMDKSDAMLENIMEVTGILAEDVTTVSEMMNQLSASSEETLAAMQEVQSGSSDSAEAVQNQLVKTEEISKQINYVAEVADNISSNVDLAFSAISEGRGNVNKLIESAKESKVAGEDAIRVVESLKKNTDEMQNIVDIIKGVASQTNLLSLNASIEAARAGEAGRGFAVVATEISGLAGQTQAATGNISNLIAGITSQMNDVVNAISLLVESNKVQNDMANVTADSFEKIVENTEHIKSDSSVLSETVGNLDTANKEIVESIQTISAISEEVTAHASTTCQATEANEKIVGEVQDKVANMNEAANKLKEIE